MTAPALELRWTSAPARRVPARPLRPFHDQLLCLVVIGLLAAPAATPLAPAVRWYFPALTALIAGWLFLRGRPGPYLAFCLWLFLLTPFVRRVVDGHAGYAKANVLMLAPYLAMGWSSLQAPRFFMSARSPIQAPMFGVFLAIFYGFLLAVAHGRWLAGVIDLLRWIVPPLFACYIMVNARRWQEMTRHLKALALVGLPLISLYGVYQYVAPPLWDIRWMLDSRMGAIGYPVPFEVRVFGPLNSPASLAFYLVALSLICLSAGGRLRWVSVAAGGLALALTVFRTAWLTFGLGLALMFVFGSSRMRTSLLVLAAAAMLLTQLTELTLMNPRLEKTVVGRFETFSTIGQDKSLNERWSSYRQFVDELTDRPFGDGVGIANAAANFNTNSRVIDGEPIEIFLSLGIIGGALYMGMIAIILLAIVSRAGSAGETDLYVALGTIALSQAIGMGSASTLVGEIGVLFWLAAALALIAPSRRQFGPVTILSQDASEAGEPADRAALPRPAYAT